MSDDVQGKLHGGVLWEKISWCFNLFTCLCCTNMGPKRDHQSFWTQMVWARNKTDCKSRHVFFEAYLVFMIRHFKLLSVSSKIAHDVLRNIAAPQRLMAPLVQITACRLFDDKLLSEPMLKYYQLDQMEHIWMAFDLVKCFHWNMQLKISSAKWRPFRLGLYVLRNKNVMRHTTITLATTFGLLK